MPIEDLAWALPTVRRQAPAYRLLRAYYEGDHRSVVPETGRMPSALRELLRRFADDLCGPCVDMVGERLEIEAFDGADGEDAWALWEDENEGSVRAAEIHTSSLAEGDGYLLAWPDPDRVPRIWPQFSDEIVIEYDKLRPGVIRRAAKVWGTDDVSTGGARRWRATLYYPTLIERYITKGRHSTLPEKATSWAEFVDSDQEGGGSLVENPYDVVPIIHYPNGLRSGRLGVSELKRVVPIQDALNYTIVAMLVGMESVALPQRWGTGIEDRPKQERDEETGVLLPDIPSLRERAEQGADRILTVGAPDARFGQFQAADLRQLTEVQDGFRRSAARVTGNPVHALLLTGEFPSGESLKTAEARLVKKALARGRVLGRRHLSAAALLLRQSGVTDPKIEEVIWEDPETRNELMEVQVQQAKQDLGVSQRRSLKELGYGDEEIAEMLAERQANQAAMDEALGRVLDGSPGREVPVG